MYTQTKPRKRYTFGAAWITAVLAGKVKVTNHDKLVTYAIELRIGTRSEMQTVKFKTLLAWVQIVLTEKLAKDIHN